MIYILLIKIIFYTNICKIVFGIILSIFANDDYPRSTKRRSINLRIFNSTEYSCLLHYNFNCKMQGFAGWKVLTQREAFIRQFGRTLQDIDKMDKDKKQQFEKDAKAYKIPCSKCGVGRDRANECKECDSIICDPHKR
jgi:hypothetical protein